MQANIRKHILWITRTAVFIALIVTAQAATAPMGNQFVTGSAVNLILILALLTGGPATGLTAAFLSPFGASLVGFGPAFPPLVPFIALGNLTFVGAWFLLGLLNKQEAAGMRTAVAVLFAAVAAGIKFLTLYVGIVLLAIPCLLDLNEKQRAMLSLTFSYPQLITACIGGVAALALAPLIRKALKSAL